MMIGKSSLARRNALFLVPLLFMALLAGGLVAPPLLAEGHGLPPLAVRGAVPAEFPPEGVPLRMVGGFPADVGAWHFRTGVPFAPGALDDKDAVRLFRGDREIPVQTEVMATWAPPGTEEGRWIKWLGVDFVDEARGGEPGEYTLRAGRSGVRAPDFAVEETAESITVRSGGTTFAFSKSRFNIFHSVMSDGEHVVEPGAMRGAYVVDGRGRTFLAADDPSPDVTVEMQGPLAAVIRAEGWFVNPDAETEAPPGEPKPRPRGGFCRFVTRVHLAAGQPGARVQHTFINTEDSERATWRDIGVSLPSEPDAPAQFGGAGGEHEGHVYLLQRSWDAFDVMRIGEGGAAERVAKGGKAEGWVRAGGIAAGVQDFWQNYPKELQAIPERGELRVHFWPEHGAPRMETRENLSDENAWRLPFVHSGEELDFRIPEVLGDEEAFPELHAGRYVDAMFKANAMGVSRTHDLLVLFGAEDPAAQMAAFQAAPHLLPDPDYIATTGVFGPILAADPEKRPLAEHRFRGGMRWVIRALRNFDSYGMWNYGDTNTYYFMRDGQILPGYRRLWAATHYNPSRVAWWTYWRSADAKILRHARANTRHIMDVDICHWTNEFFESHEHQPTYHARKAVGGLCDYKGVVHWHAGSRNAYNACIDFMLYDYYLTGNRRAWDVALAHGGYVAETGRSDDGRGAAGQADTLVELYKATWDPAVGERLRWHVGRIMDKHVSQHRGPLDWTPWLLRYWDLTHDPRARDYILEWADYSERPPRLYVTAYAYYITGEREFARQCAMEVLHNSLTTPVRDDEHDATIGRSVKPWIDGATAEMVALKAANDVELTLADFRVEEWPYWTNWGIRTAYTLSRDRVRDYFGGTYPWPEDLEEGHRITSYFYHDGTPTDVWLGAINVLRPREGAAVSAFDPSGNEVKRVVRRDYHRVIRTGTREGPVAFQRLWPRGQYPEQKVAEPVGEFRLPAEGWKFRTDPEDAGRAQNWYAHDHDDAGWLDATIETSWHEFLPEEYVGAAWYRRTVDVPEFPEAEVFSFEFGGVDESAWVWVNGQFAGEHDIGPAGWNETFRVDVTKLIKPGGENLVAVRAKNTVGEGGIWRPVALQAFKDAAATEPQVTVAGEARNVDRLGRVDMGHRPYNAPEDIYALSGERLSLGPDDPQGFWKVVHSGHIHIPTPLLPPDGKVWVEVGEASTMSLSGYQFFWVPEEVEEFELAFLPDYRKQRFAAKLSLSAGAVLNPDAEPVAYIRCGLETEPQVVRIRPKPEHRGQAWCIAGSEYSLVGMEGVPPYISPSYMTFQSPPFVPETGGQAAKPFAKRP